MTQATIISRISVGLVLGGIVLGLANNAEAASKAPPTQESLKSKTQSLYLRPHEVHEMANARPDQWMSLGEDVEFLPSQKMVAGPNAHLLDDAQLRKWAAAQLEHNRDQQDAMRMAGSLPKTRQQQMQEQQLQQQPQEPQPTSSRNLESSTASASSSIYKLSPFVEGESEYDEYQQAWRLLGFMIDCDDEITNWMTDDWYQQNGENRGSGDQGTGEGCNRYVMWAAVRFIVWIGVCRVVS